MVRPPHESIAVLGPWVGTELLELTDDLSVLDDAGRWAVLITFEGRAVLARFAVWEPRDPRPDEVGTWRGPPLDSWRSSLNEEAFVRDVETVRANIARGDVYQANLCRVLSAPISEDDDVIALHAALRWQNPAPWQGALRLPEAGVALACASPELFLSRRGDAIESRPIKGTAAARGGMLGKDAAENVMIVDLVRNDLSQVCQVGSVAVPGLLEEESHPGLVHLVSTVTGQLRPHVSWASILRAAFPPGSVTGAPKLAAVDLIRRLEPVPRGPYCGAFGWIDADRREASLAVGIRTFWVEASPDGDPSGTVRFGTGAGITWGSDARAEWQETVLKSRRLLGIAAGHAGSPRQVPGRRKGQEGGRS